MENHKTIVNNKCPFCFEIAPKHLGFNPDFSNVSIYNCIRCNSIYSYPVPTEEELELVYKRDYREIRRESPNRLYLSTMIARAKAQKELIMSHVVCRSRYLDIGSGAGTLLAEFQFDFQNLEAYEPDTIMFQESTKFLNSKTSIYNRICRVDELEDNKYDLITLSHVFEHLPCPAEFLKSLLKKLSTSGIIFIEVPNESVDIVKEQIYFNAKGLMHVNYFNRKSFLNVFGSFSEIIHIQEYGASNRLFRVVSPNRRGLFRYLYYKLFKLAPRLFSSIGMVNILDRSEIIKNFSKVNHFGIYLRVILKRR